jgi:hypothetical protein
VVAPTDNIAEARPTADLQWLLRSREGIHRFTVDDVMRMIHSGVIREDGTKELLDGIIVLKERGDSGGDPHVHGPKHRAAIGRLIKLCVSIETPNRHGQSQVPIVCSELELPEPDFAMVRGKEENYSDRLPTAQDTLVVIEAADSSLERDGGEKLAIYAAAGIPQYLIINLRNSTIEQYTDPDAKSATYRTKATFTRDQTLTLNGGSDGIVEVRAAELLP